MEYPQKNVPALSIPFVKPWGRLAKEHPGPGHIRTSTDKKAVLFTPLKLRGITLKNRIVVSPMYFDLLQYPFLSMSSDSTGLISHKQVHVHVC